MLPFAASVGWYASWLRALSCGLSCDEAEAFANRAQNITGKGFTRCRINGMSGEILLSIPVEGGAAKLKKESVIPRLTLSAHGNWRHTHQGALSAAYGRAPYFQHLMPELAKVYTSGEKSLSRFNILLHQVITSFLFGNTLSAPQSPISASCVFRSVTESMDSVSCSPATARGKELAARIPQEISILDPLMRFGRETLLPLLTSSLLIAPNTPTNN